MIDPEQLDKVTALTQERIKQLEFGLKASLKCIIRLRKRVDYVLSKKIAILENKNETLIEGLKDTVEFLISIHDVNAAEFMEVHNEIGELVPIFYDLQDLANKEEKDDKETFTNNHNPLHPYNEGHFEGSKQS